VQQDPLIKGDYYTGMNLYEAQQLDFDASLEAPMNIEHEEAW